MLWEEPFFKRKKMPKLYFHFEQQKKCPPDFHFEIYKHDLAILTERWQQRIVWWELLNAARQIIWSIICIRKQHSNHMVLLSSFNTYLVMWKYNCEPLWENTCSFRSPWVTLPLNLFFPTHFVLFPSALIWAVDGTVFGLRSYYSAIWLPFWNLQTWSRDTNWKMTATHCMMGAT
jgi:hypothetical protein